MGNTVRTSREHPKRKKWPRNLQFLQYMRSLPVESPPSTSRRVHSAAASYR